MNQKSIWIYQKRRFLVLKTWYFARFSEDLAYNRYKNKASAILYAYLSLIGPFRLHCLGLSFPNKVKWLRFRRGRSITAVLLSGSISASALWQTRSAHGEDSRPLRLSCPVGYSDEKSSWSGLQVGYDIKQELIWTDLNIQFGAIKYTHSVVWPSWYLSPGSLTATKWQLWFFLLQVWQSLVSFLCCDSHNICPPHGNTFPFHTLAGHFMTSGVVSTKSLVFYLIVLSFLFLFILWILTV